MSVYEATVERSFRASHALTLPGGSVEDSHGHTWRVKASFRSQTLEEPMSVVIDFIEVERAMEAVLGELDGTDLNASPAFLVVSPSAERVAERIAIELARRLEADGTLYSVAVTEAPGCCGAYYPGEA